MHERDKMLGEKPREEEKGEEPVSFMLGRPAVVSLPALPFPAHHAVFLGQPIGCPTGCPVGYVIQRDYPWQTRYSIVYSSNVQLDTLYDVPRGVT